MLEAKREPGRRANVRLLDAIDRLKARRRLRRSLNTMSEAELVELLARAGLAQGDLFHLAAPVRHRRRMARMLAHFGLDTERLVRCHWAALREADRTCARCANVRKCHHWFDWGRRNNAPRIFCPNAALFDELACRRTSGATSAGLGFPDLSPSGSGAAAQGVAVDRDRLDQRVDL
jgi:hypothetical protein